MIGIKVRWDYSRVVISSSYKDYFDNGRIVENFREEEVKGTGILVSITGFDAVVQVGGKFDVVDVRS